MHPPPCSNNVTTCNGEKIKDFKPPGFCLTESNSYSTIRHGDRGFHDTGAMNRNLSYNHSPVVHINRDSQFLGVAHANITLDQQTPSSLRNDHAMQKFSSIPPSGEMALNCLLSAALTGLSPTDRARASDYVHGVNELPQVSREFVEGKVVELQHLLRLQSQEQDDPLSQPFALAEKLNAEYAYQPVSCERFLRAHDFDVSRAASAVLRHFHWKLLLWGESKLGKDIELDDLSEADIEILKKGYFQVLPERDRTGRQLCACILHNQKYPSAKCAAKVLWYTFQLRLDQPCEPMAVMVCFHLADPTSTSLDDSFIEKYEHSTTLWQVFSAFPMKKVACHHCIEDASSTHFHLFMRHLISRSDNELKAAIRVHTGSFKDWMLALGSYGIPSHIVPINDEGRIRVKNHLEFLQGRKTAEILTKSRVYDFIFLPLNSDILFGRGKPIQQTAGNLRLSAIVDSCVTDYQQLSSKQEKTALAVKIVKKVKQASGRFLSRNSGIWAEVSDDIAREKVSGLFRTLSRKRSE